MRKELAAAADSLHGSLMLLFDWHDAKSDWTLAERGFDFAFASRIWQEAVAEFVDNRKNYGEIRIKAIGRIDGRCYAVVYTMRDEVHWIISARVADRNERRIWAWLYDPQAGPGELGASTPPRSKPPRKPKSKPK